MMTDADFLYYQAKLTELKSILKELKERYNADFLISIRTQISEGRDVCDTIVEGSTEKVSLMLYDFAEDAPQVIPSLIAAANTVEKTLKEAYRGAPLRPIHTVVHEAVSSLLDRFKKNRTQ